MSPSPSEPEWVRALRADLEAMAVRLTSELQPWRGPAALFLPESYGAQPQRLATAAIQAAIDAAHAAGGGTVRLASGDYVSGTLDLRSNVRLEVAQGARLLASTDIADYPERIARRQTVMDTHMRMHQQLIFAEGCENIAICGTGTIDGRGSKNNFPGEETVGPTPGRPFLIRVLDCSKVHIEGVHLRNAACWMQDYLNCEDLLIENIHVENQANHNNDGVDIDGCRRVIVRNCLINAEDDALCFKGASQRPMHDVLVEDCRIYSTCNAFKFGTDSQGDFRRMLMRRVELGGVPQDLPATRRKRSDSGLSVEVVDGCTAEDILFQDIRVRRADSPLFLRLGDRGRVRPDEAKPAPGRLRRIAYERISGEDNGARSSYFTGIPEQRIGEVALIDVDLHVAATQDPAPAEADIPEMHASYPDAWMIGPLSPAYGLWVRHLDKLNLLRVAFTPNGPDARPMLHAKLDVGEITVDP